MGEIKAEITMTLDGFITGPNPSPDQGLGEGGDRIHRWLYDLESWRGHHGLEGGQSNVDSEVLQEAVASLGAVVIGREMFDHAIDAWGDEPPFHGPVFVVTHEQRDSLEKGSTTFHFVSGIEEASKRASEAAGDKDVAVSGGANIIQQFLKTGLLDEIQIHVAPVLLGGGRPLFENMGTDQIEFDIDRVLHSSEVMHIRLRPKKEDI